MKKILALTAILLLTASLSFAQTYGGTGTSSITVTIGAEASIYVSTSTTSLSEGATPFANFTGTTNFSYKVRTTKSGGSGYITVLFGGPLTDSAADTIALTNLSYVCTDVAPASGSNCASAVTASSSSGTKVADFGADAHSLDAGTTGSSLAWTLVNLPTYVTGTSYLATATFTISAS